MTNLRRYIQIKMKPKNRGDVLVITLILSAFMLMVGLALSRFLLQDLYFVRNLIWSETAYFAAESGVETALQKLKENPVADIHTDIFISGNTKSQLDVENLKESHSFNLPPNAVKRFRIERDGIPPLINWKLNALEKTPGISGESGTGKLSWRIICQKNKTDGTPLGNVSLQNSFNVPKNILNFDQETGRFDDLDSLSGKDIDTSNETLQNFFLNTIDTKEERNSCFVNYQNISQKSIEITLKSSQKLTPDVTKIRSIGKAGQKEKVIYYQFEQSGLSSFFDFGVLLTKTKTP